MAPDLITSPANPLLKEIRKARDHGGLTEQGWLIAEGPHLVEEALRSGLRVPCLIATEAVFIPEGLLAGRVMRVSEAAFRSISSTESPQGILALVGPPVHAADALFGAAPLIVILDGVQDAGNAGAIARAAEAFGATGLLFLKGSVNPHHPKTLRASAGSLFRVPFLRGLSGADALSFLTDRVALLAAVPARPESASAWNCDLTAPTAILIGSEGQGISEELLKPARPVHIPTQAVESLNAAVAAGVLLYEAYRQRSER